MLPVVTLTIAKYKNYFKKKKPYCCQSSASVNFITTNTTNVRGQGFSENPVNAIKKVALDFQIDAISVYLGLRGRHRQSPVLCFLSSVSGA